MVIDVSNDTRLLQSCLLIVGALRARLSPEMLRSPGTVPLHHVNTRALVEGHRLDVRS